MLRAVSIPDRDFSGFPVGSDALHLVAPHVSIPDRDFSGFPELCLMLLRIVDIEFQSLIGILVDFQFLDLP